MYCIVSYCIVLYRIVLYYIILYCIILYCIVLYYIVLYCIILYCFILYYLFVFSRWYVRKYVRIMCQGGDRSCVREGIARRQFFFLTVIVFGGAPAFLNSCCSEIFHDFLLCFCRFSVLYPTVLGTPICFNTLYSSILKSMVNNPNWCKLCRFIHVATFKYVEYVEGGPDHKAPEVVWNTSSIRIFKRMFK